MWDRASVQDGTKVKEANPSWCTSACFYRCTLWRWIHEWTYLSSLVSPVSKNTALHWIGWSVLRSDQIYCRFWQCCRLQNISFYPMKTESNRFMKYLRGRNLFWDCRRWCSSTYWSCWHSPYPAQIAKLVGVRCRRRNSVILWRRDNTLVPWAKIREHRWRSLRD